MRRFFWIILMVLVACTGKKTFEKIFLGKDACEHCRMVISDARFGAEIVNSKGKIYKFDSIECLLSYQKVYGKLDDRLYVVDTIHKDEMVEVDAAYFVEDPDTRSPMGRGIMASVSSADVSKAVPTKKDLKVLKWKDVLSMLEKSDIKQ